jgi:hypothetical protein
MKVKLLKNHSGWETDEYRAQAGETLDLDEDKAMALVNNKWAELVDKSEPEVIEEDDSIEEAKDAVEEYFEDAHFPEIAVAPAVAVPLESCSYNELRALAKEKGIKAVGTKDELIRKLQDD